MILLTTSTSILIIITSLMAMAFFTLLERKILGYSHLRKGPNKVSFLGLLQPIADAAKLFLKELSFPKSANSIPFFMAPMLGLILALSMWVMYPYLLNPTNYMFGVLMFLAISSLNIYSALFAGWLSNSKYALLGGLRGMAQTISYEVSMALIMLSPFLFMKTFMFQHMLSFTLISLMMPMLLTMWFTTMLAETNRTPFDLAEGESELVSGFNTEYSSGTFAMVFMGEYTSILAMSLFTSVFFMNINIFPMTILSILFFTLFFSSVFVWTRTTFPRMRYDQLMTLAWKSFLPIALAHLFLFLFLASL